jgi:hypothetical protein
MALSQAAKRILNDPSLVQSRDQGFSKMADLFEGRCGDSVFVLNGVEGRPSSKDVLYDDPERWVEECLEDLAEKVNCTEFLIAGSSSLQALKAISLEFISWTAFSGATYTTTLM